MQDRPIHVCPLSLDGVSRDLSCRQKRRGRPWRKMGERGVFCRSAATSSPPGSIGWGKAPNSATKELLQTFGCQIARIMQVATEERMEVLRACQDFQYMMLL
jgi:hypothetical protein